MVATVVLLALLRHGTGCCVAAGGYELLGDGGLQQLGSSAGNKWRVTSSNGSVAVAATVPGQVQLDLQTAGMIGPTYDRFNQELNAWVYEDSWE